MDDTAQPIAAFHCTSSATILDRYRTALLDSLVRSCPVLDPAALTIGDDELLVVTAVTASEVWVVGTN